MSQKRKFYRLFASLVAAAMLQDFASAANLPAPVSRRETILKESDYWAISQMVGYLILEIPGPKGPITGEVCTVTAVSQRHFLTARHCYLDETGGPLGYTSAYVRLGPARSSSPPYKLKHVLISEDPDRDIVILESEVPIQEFVAGVVRIRPDPVNDGQDLFLLHHPGPGSVVLTRMDCHADRPALLNGMLNHVCDTDQGSSGAPIFDGSFRLVGIHLRGGYKGSGDEPNKAASIGWIIGANPAIGSYFTSTVATPNVTPPSRKPHEIYKTSLNTQFVRFDSGWFYVSGDDYTRAEQLFDQTTPDSTLLDFWEPIRDYRFQIPRSGGDIMVRRATGGTWQKLGTATPNRCPC